MERRCKRPASQWRSKRVFLYQSYEKSTSRPVSRSGIFLCLLYHSISSYLIVPSSIGFVSKQVYLHLMSVLVDAQSPSKPSFAKALINLPSAINCNAHKFQPRYNMQ